MDTSTEPVIMNQIFEEDGIRALMAKRLRYVDQKGTRQPQMGDYLTLMNVSFHDATSITLSKHIDNFETAKRGYERYADAMKDEVHKNLLLNTINHFAYTGTRMDCTKDNKMDYLETTN